MVGFIAWIVIVFGGMAFVFVMPIFLVSAISQWWDVRRFREGLARMEGLPLEPPTDPDD